MLDKYIRHMLSSQNKDVIIIVYYYCCYIIYNTSKHDENSHTYDSKYF